MDSKKTLCIHDSPTGGNADHLSYIKDKVSIWIHIMQNGHLPGHIAWTAYKYQLWPGLRYGRGTMTNDLESAKDSLHAKDYKLLNVLGVPLDCHQRVVADPYNLCWFWTFWPPHRTANQPSEHANATVSCFNKSRQKTRCIALISPDPIRYPSQPLHTRVCQVGTFGTTIFDKYALAVVTPL